MTATVRSVAPGWFAHDAPGRSRRGVPEKRKNCRKTRFFQLFGRPLRAKSHPKFLIPAATDALGQPFGFPASGGDEPVVPSAGGTETAGERARSLGSSRV